MIEIKISGCGQDDGPEGQTFVIEARVQNGFDQAERVEWLADFIEQLVDNKAFEGLWSVAKIRG